MRHTIGFIASWLLLLGCGEITPGDQSDQPNETGATFSVAGKAALGACSDCPDWADPSLSYQTPSDLHMGVRSVALLRAADDTNPHILTDERAAGDADLVTGATFAAVDTGAIPEGTYTHMRVTLDYVRFRVDATGHVPGIGVIPGALDVDYALGHYDAGSGSQAPGDYLATFTAFGAAVSQSGNRAVAYPPPYPGATVSTAGDLYAVTFASPDGPIVVGHTRPENIDVEVTFFIERAFGWTDLNLPDYVHDQFDVASDPASTEQPASMAIQGFSMNVNVPAE